MRVGWLAVLVCATVVAGCLGGDGGKDADARQDATGASDERLADVFYYAANDCRVNFVFFLITDAYARSVLPPAYEPMEAIDAFQSIGSPLPAGLVDSQQAIGFYGAIECASSNFGLGGLEFIDTGILVEAPPIDSGEPTAAQALDFYWFDFPISPASRPLFDGTFLPEEMPPPNITWQLSGLPGNLGPGSLDITVDGKPWASAEFVLAAPPQALRFSAVGRGWHEGPTGTLYFELLMTNGAALGPVTSCQNAAGSKPALVSGTTDCTATMAGSLLMESSTFRGRIIWLEGVFADAPAGT